MDLKKNSFPGVTRRERQMAHDIAGLLGLPPILGTWYWVDPENGAAANNGLSQRQAVKSLTTAYGLCGDGYGDGIIILSSGTTSTTTTTRLAAALSWTKSGITVVGVCSGNRMFQRARVSNTTTVLTIPALITVSGGNNRFENISFFNSGTDSTALGCVIVTGVRNTFRNCHFVGGSCTTATANERSLELGDGAQENAFYDCVIGTDTIDRGNNANCELYINGTVANTARNYFENCIFLGMSSTAGGAHGAIKSAAATSMGRNMIMADCTFDCYHPNKGAGEASLFVGTAFNTASIILKHPTVHLLGYAAIDSAGSTNVYTDMPQGNAAGGITVGG